MPGTRDRWKFHKFTLEEVGEIVRAVHIQQAGPSPFILGSRLGVDHTSDTDTVTWFQTYADNEPWARMCHSGHDCHERYLSWVVVNEHRKGTRVGTAAEAAEVTRVRGLVEAVVTGFISKNFGVEGERDGKLVTASAHVTKTHEGVGNQYDKSTTKTGLVSY